MEIYLYLVWSLFCLLSESMFLSVVGIFNFVEKQVV